MTVFREQGRWRYRFRIQLPSGKRVRRGGTAKVNTRAATEAAERAHIFRLLHPEAVGERDTKPDKPVPTIEEFSSQYLSGYAADHKPVEQDEKKRILDTYLLPKIGALRPDEVNQGTVDVIRAELLPGRDVKTVDNILTVLSSLMGYATACGISGVRELRYATRGADKPLVEPVSPEGIEALLLAAGDDLRYRAGILLAAECGLRIGELRGLWWAATNMIGRLFSVERALDTKGRETSPKHGKFRTVPMSPRTYETLTALPQRGRSVLTVRDGSRPLSYWAMRDRLRALYEKAGIEPPELPWHCLRHSYGTALANAGAPLTEIKELMGHSSVTTTERYLHTTAAAKAATVARVFEAR